MDMLRDSRQATGKVWLALLILAGLAGIVRCNSVATSVPRPTVTAMPLLTTEQPGSTHLGLIYYSERDGIENQGALYLLDLESGEEQRLTGKDEVITLDSGFSWSPVARKVVYASGLGRDTEIYTMDITGQHRQRLTNNNWQDVSAFWSPDGSQIAFLRRGGELDDTFLRAYVMNADGSEQRRLIDDPDVLSGGVSWSPNGLQIALRVFNYEVAPGSPPVNDILILDVGSGEEVLRIADGSDHAGKRWSHDGTKLAFTSNRDGLYQLYVVDVTRGTQTKLAEEGNVLAFDWSPDNERLAFNASPDKVFDIYVVRSDGTRLVMNLTDRAAYDVGGGWSPDGQRIAFSSTVFEQGKDFEKGIEIYILEVNTGVISQITHNQFPDAPPRWVVW